MKKLISFCIGAVCAIVFACAQVHPNDVTMVSYEQSWMDSKGTLALRNNTDQTVRSVVFCITYMDMQGNALDYEEYRRTIEIAPGRVRKVDIPAYEHERFYHYYKTPGRLNNPTFKINYELLDYKVKGRKVVQPVSHTSESKPVVRAVQPEVKKTETLHQSGKKTGGDEELAETQPVEKRLEPVTENVETEDPFWDKEQGWGNFIIFWYLLGILIGLYVMVAVAARDRHRSVYLWLLMSIIVTPFLTLFLLMLFGDSRPPSNYYYREEE